jgi:hypothetical protein
MMRILRKNALYGESRFPRNLKIYIEETVFPKLTGHITHQKKHNLRKNLSKLYA